MRVSAIPQTITPYAAGQTSGQPGLLKWLIPADSSIGSIPLLPPLHHPAPGQEEVSLRRDRDARERVLIREWSSFEETMKPKLGATGRFPDGKINPDDEGELRLGITTDDKGNVVVNFGKPVSWFAMPPANARQMAEMILKNAEAAEKAKRH